MPELLQKLLSMPAGILSLYFLCIALFAFRRPAPLAPCPPRTRFAVLIAARNEEAVIGRTVRKLLQCDYPAGLFDVYVLPNGCTDNTAAAAAAAGARILPCGPSVRSKGAALHLAVEALKDRPYDAICVFDADNLADVAYLRRMNDAFCAGAQVAKGKCLASNPADSWISGCYALYFGLFNLFYNHARQPLGLSAKLNGTGFAVSMDLLRRLGGWNTQTIAEDAEFAAICAQAGQRVWWVPEAVSYDEQPLTLRQSLTQRARWCSGIMAAARLHLPALVRRSPREPLCADFVFFLLTPFIQGFSLLPLLLRLYTDPMGLLAALLAGWLGAAALAALIVRLTGMDRRGLGKAVVTYGIFMATWAPICLWCLIRPVRVWREMPHGLARNTAAGV